MLIPRAGLTAQAPAQPRQPQLWLADIRGGVLENRSSFEQSGWTFRAWMFPLVTSGLSPVVLFKHELAQISFSPQF